MKSVRDPEENVFRELLYLEWGSWQCASILLSSVEMACSRHCMVTGWEACLPIYVYRPFLTTAESHEREWLQRRVTPNKQPFVDGLYSYNPLNVICCCLVDGKTKLWSWTLESLMPNPDCFQDDQLLFPVSPSCADSFAEGCHAVTTWERVTVASWTPFLLYACVSNTYMCVLICTYIYMLPISCKGWAKSVSLKAV